jgi:hypothetical protein
VLTMCHLCRRLSRQLIGMSLAGVMVSSPNA